MVCAPFRRVWVSAIVLLPPLLRQKNGGKWSLRESNPPALKAFSLSPRQGSDRVNSGGPVRYAGDCWFRPCGLSSATTRHFTVDACVLSTTAACTALVAASNAGYRLDSIATVPVCRCLDRPRPRASKEVALTTYRPATYTE